MSLRPKDELCFWISLFEKAHRKLEEATRATMFLGGGRTSIANDSYMRDVFIDSVNVFALQQMTNKQKQHNKFFLLV